MMFLPKRGQNGLIFLFQKRIDTHIPFFALLSLNNIEAFIYLVYAYYTISEGRFLYWNQAKIHQGPLEVLF